MIMNCVVLFSLDPFSYSYHFVSPPAPVCVCDVTSFEIGSVAMSSKGRTEGGGLVHSRGENSIWLSSGLGCEYPSIGPFRLFWRRKTVIVSHRSSVHCSIKAVFIS